MSALKIPAAALALTLTAACNGSEDPRLTALRAYETDYSTIRDQLAEVGTLLPTAPVGDEACADDGALNPVFEYRTETPHEGNAEILMEAALTDPDIVTDYRGAFTFGATDLLASLRLTGAHGPLGDSVYTYPDHQDFDEDELRAQLENGVATRYIVVLRVIEYAPPGTALSSDEHFGFEGGVILNGFVIDLHQMTLACWFTARGEPSSYVTWMEGAGSAAESQYAQIQDEASLEIMTDLLTLTGGSVDFDFPTDAHTPDTDD
jgi:hypothetical protein